MNKTTPIIVLVLLISTLFFGVKYYQTRKVLETRTANNKVLDFSQHFVQDVLKAKHEVSFDTRLKLENEVRDLHDNDILAQWSKFTESKTEAQTQEEVTLLLELLFNKVKVK